MQFPCKHYFLFIALQTALMHCWTWSSRGFSRTLPHMWMRCWNLQSLKTSWFSMKDPTSWTLYPVTCQGSTKDRSEPNILSFCIRELYQNPQHHADRQHNFHSLPQKAPTYKACVGYTGWTQFNVKSALNVHILGNWQVQLFQLRYSFCMSTNVSCNKTSLLTVLCVFIVWYVVFMLPSKR